jgi:hypothetical protein
MGLGFDFGCVYVELTAFYGRSNFREKRNNGLDKGIYAEYMIFTRGQGILGAWALSRVSNSIS